MCSRPGWSLHGARALRACRVLKYIIQNEKASWRTQTQRFADWAQTSFLASAMATRFKITGLLALGFCAMVETCSLLRLSRAAAYRLPCGFLAPADVLRRRELLAGLPQFAPARPRSSATVSAAPMGPSPAHRCLFSTWGPMIYTNAPSPLGVCEHVIDPFPLRHVPCITCVRLNQGWGVVAPSVFDCVMDAHPSACVAFT